MVPWSHFISEYKNDTSVAVAEATSTEKHGNMRNQTEKQIQDQHEPNPEEKFRRELAKSELVSKIRPKGVTPVLQTAPEAGLQEDTETCIPPHEAWRSLQVGKKNKCTKAAPASTEETAADTDLQCSKDTWARSRRCSSQSTSSDVSGAEHRSSSPDSQCGDSCEMESTPSVPISQQSDDAASGGIGQNKQLSPVLSAKPDPVVSLKRAVHFEALAQMRSAHVEAVLSAVVLADSTQNSSTQSLANEWLAKCTPSMDELACVQRCSQELNVMANKANPNWRVLPFGSHVSGLSLQGSDLDATMFMPESMAEDPGGASALNALRWVLRPILKQHPSFKVTEQVFSARVPIIKLRFENSLDVDLSCHNTRPLQNTGLIQAYVQLHPTVRELILAVKMWAKAADVCGGSEGKLSCYTFALMVLYYMQVDPSVSLPLLPTAAFDLVSEKPPGNFHPSWKCKLPLHVLLGRFFMFYAEIFSWGREVVSVRLGRRVEASDREFSSLPYRSLGRIHIEDPYDLKRNLHCVLGATQEHGLKAALAEASGVVRSVSLERSVAVRKGPAAPCKLAQEVGDIDQETASSEQQEGADDVKTGVDAHPAKADKATREPKAPLEASSEQPQDEDMKWWFAFVGSCCAYTFYAVYSGQLFRMSIALSALILILVSIDQRRRTGLGGMLTASAPLGNEFTNLPFTVKKHIRRSSRHRASRVSGRRHPESDQSILCDPPES